MTRYASYYPTPRPVDETIALVGLEDKRDIRSGKLSGGLQRRLDVALALVGDPELIFLDEPTTGFDPGARRQFWGVISDLRGLGKTILLTTHYLDEAQALADRVAVIAAGRIVAEGSPETLGGRDRPPPRSGSVYPNPFRAGDLPLLESDEVGSRRRRRTDPNRRRCRRRSRRCSPGRPPSTQSSGAWKSCVRAWKTSTSSW